jgi:hypothetical protein
MDGTLVDPLCAFARRLSDSAQARCSLQRTDDDFHPALLAPDSGLYLLTFDKAARIRTTATRRLVGKSVKVDGTVFAAGNAYVIVVDSIRPTTQ